MMKWIGTICVLLLSLPPGGCNRQSPQVHVTVYTTLETEEMGQLQAIFEGEHPDIKLDIFRDSSAVVTARLLSEATDPQADVVWGLAATSLMGIDQKGLLQPYAPAGVDQISPQFKDSRPVPHWVGIDGYMTAFAVNTAEIAKANLPMPDSYADLIKPVYRGMITMPNPNTSNNGFSTVAGILQIMGQDAGWLYLQQLDQNIAKYTSSGSEPTDLAASGEHPIGISYDFSVLQEKNKGGPLEIVLPREKSGWEIEANALIKKPNISSSAKIFLAWVISAPAFKIYSQHFGLIANSAYSNPPAGFPAHPMDQIIPNNIPWAAENRDSILTQWSSRFGEKTRNH